MVASRQATKSMRSTDRTTTAQTIVIIPSTMQVRYRLRDYYKEASEKHRLEVNSRGQYLSVPGCDENSSIRIRPRYDLLEPLTDCSASDLADSLVLRESLRLYEEKLQFGLDGYDIQPINYEQISMIASIEPTLAEIEIAEPRDYTYMHGPSRTLLDLFQNELRPIHIQVEFPAFTESEIYGDMSFKSYTPLVTQDIPAILNFEIDTSQAYRDIESFEYASEYHAKGLAGLEKLFGPRNTTDLPPSLDSRYTEYLSDISFPQDEDTVLDTGTQQSTNETDLLGVSLELNTTPYMDECESFLRIRPTNLVSKFGLKEVKELDTLFRDTEERASSLLQEFESRLWDDEIAFHDPTVKPLKVPVISDENQRPFRLRDLLRQVRLEHVHTMQLELDLKSYWQHDGIDRYRSSIEFDATEYKVMEVDESVHETALDEVFDLVPGFSTATLIGDKVDVSYIEFQLNKIKEENTDEDSRFLKSLKDKTESCIDYNDNCKGLIYNYISMVESLPSVVVFSQCLDNLLPPDSSEKSFLHESISRCDTRSGPVTPLVTNTATNRSLQHNSPRLTRPPVVQHTAEIPSTAKQPRTPSILEEVRDLLSKQIMMDACIQDPLLEYMRLRGVSVESTLPKNIWDRKYRLKSPPEGSFDEYKTSLAEVIRLSGQSVLLAPKSVVLSQVILYLCYNIVCIMKAPVIWLCSDEDQCNNVMALVKPVLNEAVHLVSKGFAAPTVKPGEPALLIVNEQAAQGTVMKKSVLQQLSTAHMLFLDNTVNWEQPTSTAKEFMKLLPVSARVIFYSPVAPSSFQVFLTVIRDLKMDSIVSVLKTDADVKSSACLAEKIFVPLSDEIFRVLDVVSAFQQELISQIKETSVIELPEDRVLLSATQTKYLIDQLAQTINDVPAGQPQGMSAMLVDLMKLLVCAYVLAKADGYLVHYGILSAVHGLASAMQHPKYGKFIQDMLKDLHDELLRCQQEIDAGLFQTHPKINLFTRLVHDATSNKKNKCLVVIEHEQLGREIIIALNRSPDTHLEIGTVTDNINQSQLLNLIKSNDVLIVPVTTLAKSLEFPFSYFAWVIEYEDYGLDISDKVNRATRHVKLITSRDESVHQSEANERLCEAWIKKLRTALCSSDKLSEVRTINITEYIGGKTNWPQSLYIGGLDLNEFSEPSITADITATDRPESPSSLIPIKVIIGEKLLQRRELLSELYEKQRIELIERTLAFNEDIIIDDKTCVVIRKLSALPNLVIQPASNATGQNNGKEKEQRKLLIELIKLALKYPAVWLLIEVDDDILQLQYQSVLQDIQLWTVYLSNETQIRYGFSVKHMAQLIRRVCHHCAHNSAEWNGSLELWASRKWLLDDESKHEVFLAKFPSMNPFRAQIILTLIELKEALGTSLEELKQKFRWITPSALEYLDYALNYTKVAAIQQTYPSPQRQQVPGVLRGQPLRAPANKLKRSYGEDDHHGSSNDVERNVIKKRKTYAF